MVYWIKDKYIDPLTDFGFKHLFGTEPNKPILRHFLNTLLPQQHQIQSLSLKNVENLGKTAVERKAIFDVFCHSQIGEQFIVEVQKVKQNFFKDRSVYYATFPIQEQAQRGEWDYQLQAVYTVGILDFIFDEHQDEHQDETAFLHQVQLKDQNCQVFYDKLKFIYIELPKFRKSLEQLVSPLDKWLFVLRHLPRLDHIPQSFQEEIFDLLFQAAEIANFSTSQQEVYQASLKAYRDWNNVINTLQQEVQQAQQEVQQAQRLGLEQGQRLKAIAIAQKLLPTMDDQTISQITELSLEAVQALRQESFGPE
jgi:predicted transposase/invertase (TIGR01784 family)